MRLSRSDRRRLQARHPREGGSALLYVSLVLAVLVTAVFALFDLGRLTTAKIQAQNAADAGALAAVSLKVSVHHTREMAYLAMTDRGLHARLEILRALANFGNEGLYQQHMVKAGKYLSQLDALQKDLVAYNAWVDSAGPALVLEAARLGYVANVQGINDHLTSARALEAANWRELDKPGNLAENGGTNHFVGKVNYPNEGLGPTNGGGKSLVEVEPKYQGMNWSFFGGDRGKTVPVPAWASAGYVSSDEAAQDPASGIQPFAIGPFKLHWLSPRLVRTGQKEQGSFGGPDSGGGVVSEH